RATPGMGKVLLLHAPNNVTERSYLNALPDLREAIEKMNSPIAFRHGIKMTERAVRETREQMLKADQFAVPVHPPVGCFEFFAGAATFRGQLIPLPPAQHALLRAVVQGACVVPKET